MKTVVEMAQKAGFSVDNDQIFANSEIGPSHSLCTEAIKRFAELVRADEREACAMWAWSAVLSMTDSDTADKVLVAIRARRTHD